MVWIGLSSISLALPFHLHLAILILFMSKWSLTTELAEVHRTNDKVGDIWPRERKLVGPAESPRERGVLPASSSWK